MAIVKRRIMDRARLLTIIFNVVDGIAPKHANERESASADAMAHMIADGKDVKVYHDTNMGGMVVEYDNGE